MRIAEVNRDTLETQIRVAINLDGTGQSSFDTGLPFLEHMMDQIARHGLIDIEISATGDLHIDAHHTVEDLGITLEEARSNGAHLPVTALVDQFYSEIQAMGGRRWDTSSLLVRLEDRREK